MNDGETGDEGSDRRDRIFAVKELSSAQRQELLGRISTAVVQSVKKASGKGPEHVKSYFLDDMLVIVTKGGVSIAERTMLDGGRDDAVRTFRQVLDEQMAPALRELVVELTGRSVIGYQSQVTFAPDRVIAIYIFDDSIGLSTTIGE